LQGSTKIAIALSDLAKKVIENTEKRNSELEETKVVETSTTAGCSTN